MIGRYEELNEQPVASRSRVPFICLTDDLTLRSKTWKMVKVDSCLQLDPVRTQRLLKLLPHRYLPGYELSLYIDNTILLTELPETIVDRYLTSDVSVAIPSHSFRDTVAEEFAEVRKLDLDDPSRLAEQLEHYSASDAAVLNERPYWTGILLRRHRKNDVKRAFEIWCAHMLRYSRRDQLSANAAFRHSGLRPSRIEIDNHESWFHTWPHATARSRRGYFGRQD